MIKKKSEAYLMKQGAQINDWLPRTMHSSPRNALAIGQRILIVNALFNIYLGAPCKIIKSWLNRHNLLPYLSTHKKWILSHADSSELDEKNNIALGWYVESLWALMWAGYYIEKLDPEMHVEDTLVHLIPNLQNDQDGYHIIKKPNAVLKHNYLGCVICITVLTGLLEMDIGQSMMRALLI